MLEYSIAENIALHDYRSQPASRYGWLFPRRLIERARALIRAFDVRGGGPTTRAGGLSGGNQQKVVLAREIERDPKVLIAAQPTRGLDVGAIEFVHRRLIEERDEGRAILLVSLELEEVLSLSDRILVMYEGEIAGEFPPTASEEELGIAMTGARAGRGRGVSDAGGATPAQPYGQPAAPPPEEGGESFASLIDRYGCAQRAGGAVAPLLTVLLAFVMGGLVVLVTTGKNPITTYRAIFEGRALLVLPDRNHEIGLPSATRRSGPVEDTGSRRGASTSSRRSSTRRRSSSSGSRSRSRSAAACSTSAASASTSRGRSSLSGSARRSTGMSPIPHVLLVLVVGTLAGALLAGIAGFLKATVGAHEVITTIMLNWTVVYVGLFLFGLGGPLQNDTQSSTPVSNDVVEGAKLHVFWGDPLLQGLHIGFFIALGALVVYWAILNRTTLGYGVKAVGFNPEAARYGGISVARNYFLAMAISGAFAGIAGAIDILGWQFRLSTSDITRRRRRRSRSPASPSRCSAATRPWEPSSRRCSSARSSPGRRPATSTPRSSSRSSRRTSRC